MHKHLYICKCIHLESRAVTDLVLVSHRLCPYVQRAAIALAEKSVACERRDVDLANKPDWFEAVSPLGKTPVLLVGAAPIFESAVILEYLEETEAHPLLPETPLARAEHRGWIAFGSAILNDIAGLYAAGDESAFRAKVAALRAKFERIEQRLAGPWFDGTRFSLVDAVFGPVFRYFDAFDRVGEFGILSGLPKVAAWRAALAARPSVRDAVASDYPALLWDFYRTRGSHLSRLIEMRGAALSNAA
ncbi:MAG: glutathione S-transferase family protein [Alphaproteobacteria bacterium]|nr:glutathione S-transferase family protein [Alphaproteobacteria bacterium]